MSLPIVVTGLAEVDAKLRSLPEKVQRRIARSALGRAMTLIKKAAIRAAPVGPTGNLRASINKRFKRIKKAGITAAKVGINVGKRQRNMGQIAPHGHLVALGTAERKTKAGSARGRMPPNPFFRRAIESVHAQSQDLMKQIIIEKLDAEVAKK